MTGRLNTSLILAVILFSILLATHKQYGYSQDCANFWINPTTQSYECLDELTNPETSDSAPSSRLNDVFLSTEKIINEAAISGIAIIDPEFDAVNNRVTWQDFDFNLWVAPVNSSTGLIALEEAKVLDSDLAPIASYRDRSGTGNGPEWISSKHESQVLYTKIFNKQPVLARTLGSGLNLTTALITEENTSLEPVTGAAPIGSLDEDDNNPRFVYLLPTPPGLSTLAWRDLNQPTGDIVAEGVSSAARWVNNESRALTFTMPVSQVNQVFLYRINPDKLYQLTNSPVQKTNPFIWLAPELDELLLLVSETEDLNMPGKITSLGIYHQTENGWIKLNTVRPPSQFTYIRSAEPFTYKGYSYISFLTENEKGGPSEIWIASPDPIKNFYRLVSDPERIIDRNDPEVFIAESNAFIYYYSGGGQILYKADTGL